MSEETVLQKIGYQLRKANEQAAARDLKIETKLGEIAGQLSRIAEILSTQIVDERK